MLLKINVSNYIKLFGRPIFAHTYTHTLDMNRRVDADDRQIMNIIEEDYSNTTHINVFEFFCFCWNELNNFQLQIKIA